MQNTRISFFKLAPHEAGAPILEVAGITVLYDGRPALEDVSFRLTKGERVAVVGPNGAGKSTLFKVVAGVLRPSAGRVDVAGHGPRGHVCIAYIVQRSQVDWTFPVSVKDVVMMGRIGQLGLLRHPRPSDWEYVHHCLEIVGMADLAERQIAELSGGQQQRMFIARALAQEAELMLMDEPLTGLDTPSQENIFRVLDVLRQQQVTVMVATHNLSQATDRFDRVMLLNRRLLGLGLPAEVFTPERLAVAYGDHLQMIKTSEGVVMVDDACCGEESE